MMNQAKREKMDVRARFAIGLGGVLVLATVTIGCMVAFPSYALDTGFGKMTDNVFRATAVAGGVVSAAALAMLLWGMVQLMRARPGDVNHRTG